MSAHLQSSTLFETEPLSSSPANSGKSHHVFALAPIAAEAEFKMASASAESLSEIAVEPVADYLSV